MKVVLDSKNGVEINDFLEKKKYEKERQALANSRVFYIIKPKFEDNAKFGVSGNKDGRGIGRLQQYRNDYGTAYKGNACSGVRVYLLIKTKYDENTQPSKSEIFKTELYVIRKNKEMGKVARGRERTTLRIPALKDVVFDYRGGGDEATIPRRSKRVKNKYKYLYKKEDTFETGRGFGNRDWEAGMGKVVHQPYIYEGSDKKLKNKLVYEVTYYERNKKGKLITYEFPVEYFENNSRKVTANTRLPYRRK